MSPRSIRARVSLLLVACLTGGLTGGSEAAEVRKISDMVIYQDDRFYSAFPSIVVWEDGEVLCAFRRAPNRRMLWGAPCDTHVDPNSYLILVRSNDGGKTWTKEPELIYADPMGGSQDPCTVPLGDGSIVCTSYGWAELPPGKAQQLGNCHVAGQFAFLGGYIVRSDDGGKSWKGPFTPPPVPGNKSSNALGDPLPAYNRGRMIQRKDGKLYWAVARHDTPNGSLTSVHLMTSSDRGETWQYACPIAMDEKVRFNEASLVETKKGDLVVFLRTEGFGGRLAITRSMDGGKSFQPWQDGVLVGQPFDAIRLRDSRVFLVYGYRQPPFGIRAKILNADCTDFSEAPEIIIRDDGGDSDLGYPWAGLLPNGDVLVAYYFNIGGGTKYIAGSVLSVR